jgi:hypothetical protein
VARNLQLFLKADDVSGSRRRFRRPPAGASALHHVASLRLGQCQNMASYAATTGTPLPSALTRDAQREAHYSRQTTHYKLLTTNYSNMNLRAFWNQLRQSDDRYIVLNEDGVPEFVIMPYSHFAGDDEDNDDDDEDDDADFSEFGEKIDDFELPEFGSWDAMMDEMGDEDEEVEKEEDSEENDEPVFQFEPVDEARA